MQSVGKNQEFINRNEILPIRIENIVVRKPLWLYTNYIIILVVGTEELIAERNVTNGMKIIGFQQGESREYIKARPAGRPVAFSSYAFPFAARVYACALSRPWRQTRK